MWAKPPWVGVRPAQLPFGIDVAAVDPNRGGAHKLGPFSRSLVGDQDGPDLPIQAKLGQDPLNQRQGRREVWTVLHMEHLDQQARRLGVLQRGSFRRLGQLLVVTGALLGAVIGVGLALIVNNAVVAAGREVATGGAARPSSSQPPASRAAGSQDPADGDDSSGSQRAESAGRADERHGTADNNRAGRSYDADGRGNDKPSKGKGKGK